MRRQRVTGVLVVKDGEIVAERYNHERTADMRMVSNSMAKTITALGVMKALEDGLTRSLDDAAETYVPQLKGTLAASGAHFGVERDALLRGVVARYGRW